MLTILNINAYKSHCRAGSLERTTRHHCGVCIAQRTNSEMRKVSSLSVSHMSPVGLFPNVATARLGPMPAVNPGTLPHCPCDVTPFSNCSSVTLICRLSSRLGTSSAMYPSISGYIGMGYKSQSKSPRCRVANITMSALRAWSRKDPSMWVWNCTLECHAAAGRCRVGLRYSEALSSMRNVSPQTRKTSKSK